MTDVAASTSLAQRAREEARRVGEEAEAQSLRRQAERTERFLSNARERVEVLTGEAPQVGEPAGINHCPSVNLHAAGLSFHYTQPGAIGELSLLVNCSECADLIPGPGIGSAGLESLGFALLKAEQTTYTCQSCSEAQEEAELRRAALTQRVAVAPWATVHAAGRECVVVPEKWARVALALEQATFDEARWVAEQFVDGRAF